MKIFKLFVCLSLILSISLINSFAAISVSDGSAFVTKAEFAADLNNLSNRMSSLENSLDAKIDSLVSSYLSRNGIWNGEKQEILGFATEKIWVNQWAKSKTGDEEIKNSASLICKTSKAGLMNLDFRITGRNSKATRETSHGTLCILISNYTGVEESAKAVISFKYEIIDKDENIIYDKLFHSILLNSVQIAGKGMIAYLPSFNFNDFFFVEKNKDISIRLVVITEGSNYTNAFFVKDIDKTKYINPKLKIKSVRIY